MKIKTTSNLVFLEEVMLRNAGFSSGGSGGITFKDGVGESFSDDLVEVWIVDEFCPYGLVEDCISSVPVLTVKPCVVLARG